MLLRPIFCENLKIAPPHKKTAPPETFEFPNLAVNSDSISAKTFFFWWPPVFGRKKPLNYGFRPKKSDLISAKTFFFWRPPVFGRKKPLNFGFRPKNQTQFRRRPFFFFFLETTWFWAEKTFEFPSFPRNFVWIFGQTVWNWFKNNQNSGQGRLQFSHSFKIAPPFSKSWLRACSSIKLVLIRNKCYQCKPTSLKNTSCATDEICRHFRAQLTRSHNGKHWLQW